MDVGGAAAGFDDFCLDALAAVVVEVGEDDGHAVVGEGDGGVAADALGGAGDDGDAVVEFSEGGHGAPLESGLKRPGSLRGEMGALGSAVRASRN